MLWSEKYRPLTLDNLIIDPENIHKLKSFVKQKNIPHLMFIGLPGSGKMSTALCFIRDLYGNTYKSYYDEIDTQDSANFYENYKTMWFQLAKYENKRRGKSRSPNRMQILLTIIRNFPKFRSFGKIGFRILIINNSHLLSINTQQALRRMMEKSTKTFRLILLSKNLSNIIDPVQSRCIKVNFPNLEDKRVLQVLRYIGEKEKLKISNDAFKAILFYTDNDLTKCINLLQSCSSFSSSIDGNLVYDIIEMVSPNKLLNQLFDGIINQDFNEVRRRTRDLFLKFGYMGREILTLLYEKLLYSPIPEALKIQISQKIGDIDFRIVEGANEEIQISYFLAYLYSLHNQLES
ncbi:MAG: hypothetical protein HWN67_05365 [Candidatus Helarchaeota archaeon]|nr:hypothetical protein [Candidatus Helarchaeota archaeon]